MTSTNIQPIHLDESTPQETDLGRFHHHFSGWMKLYATIPTVMNYLNDHQSWFRRCARPMQVEPLGEMGYALGLGKFGAFGFHVDPRIGLQLFPKEFGVYQIESIPVPDYAPTIYSVDFQALMVLLDNAQLDCHTESEENAPTSSPAAECHVAWELDLSVWLKFPNFIQALPPALIQKTGDRILVQVVRQVSRRLTRTVQQDFHKSLGIPFPPKAVKPDYLRGCRHINATVAENSDDSSEFIDVDEDVDAFNVH